MKNYFLACAALMVSLFSVSSSDAAVVIGARGVAVTPSAPVVVAPAPVVVAPRPVVVSPRPVVVPARPVVVRPGYSNHGHSGGHSHGGRR